MQHLLWQCTGADILCVVHTQSQHMLYAAGPTLQKQERGSGLGLLTHDKCALPHDNEALGDGGASGVVCSKAAGVLLGVVHPEGLHSVRDAALPSLAHLLILLLSACCHLVCRLTRPRFDCLHDTVVALAGAWTSLEPGPAMHCH